MNIHIKKSFGFTLFGSNQGRQVRQSFLWSRQSRGSSIKSGQKVLIKAIIVFALIIFLNIFQSPIRNSFYFISSPIVKVFSGAGKNFSVLFESFLNAKKLSGENNNLREDNQKLLSEISLLKEDLKENQDSKEFLKNTKSNNLKAVLGKIIGLDTFNDLILIDKGSDDGIFKDMPVISSQKVLYGKIFEVYKNFSQVMLISNKNSVLNVKIQRDDATKTPIYGAIKGYGNLSFYLDLVDFNAEIKENDVLVTSGLEGIFPSNLLIGKVKSVNKNDLKPFQTAEIQPFFNIKNIDSLFLITNYKHEK